MRAISRRDRHFGAGQTLSSMNSSATASSVQRSCLAEPGAGAKQPLATDRLWPRLCENSP
jgi:hypothetical protein